MPEMTPSYPSAGAFPPGAPAYAGPMEPPKKGMHGCLKGCLIALGVAVVMTCVAAGLVWFFWSRIQAWAIDRGSDIVIQAVSESAHLTMDERNEMLALKDVLVKAYNEEKFTDAHGRKIQASLSRLDSNGTRGNRPLTHREAMRLMDDIEAVCRDAGCDMTEVDKHRSKRSNEAESTGPDSGMPPDDEERAPEEDGSYEEGD